MGATTAALTCTLSHRQARRWRLSMGALATLPWLMLGLHLWASRPYLLDLAVHWLGHAGVGFALVGAALAAWRLVRLPAAVMLSGGVALTVAQTIAWGSLTGAGAMAGTGGLVCSESDTPGGVSGGTAGGGGGGVRLRIIACNARSGGEVNERFIDWVLAQDADVVSLNGISALWRGHPRLGAAFEHERFVANETLILSRHPVGQARLWSIQEHRAHGLATLRPFRIDLPDGVNLLLVNAHPPSPRSAALWRSARTTLKRGGTLLAHHAAATPMLVAGDMNTTPAGRNHRAFARASGLRYVRPPWMAAGTWPTWLPRLAALPLDQVWINDHVRIESVRVGPVLGTDHRPLVIEVKVAGG